MTFNTNKLSSVQVVEAVVTVAMIAFFVVGAIAVFVR